MSDSNENIGIRLEDILGEIKKAVVKNVETKKVYQLVEIVTESISVNYGEKTVVFEIRQLMEAVTDG